MSALSSKGTDPKQALLKATTEIKDFEIYSKTLDCPSCKRKEGFDVTSYEKDSGGGFEVSLYCRHCATQGVLNNGGFQFSGMERLLKT